MRRSAGQSFKRFSSLITFVVLLAFLLKSVVNASNELGRRLAIPLCEDSDEGSVKYAYARITNQIPLSAAQG